MIYEKRWLGSSSYWIRDKKFETLEKALASVCLDLRDNVLYCPWGSVPLTSSSMASIQSGIREITNFLRKKQVMLSTSIAWVARPVVQMEDESYSCANFRCDSLQDLAHKVGMSLCGNYLICGTIYVVLPRVNVATFIEGWELLEQLVKDTKPQRQEESAKIDKFLKGLHG